MTADDVMKVSRQSGGKYLDALTPLDTQAGIECRTRKVPGLARRACFCHDWGQLLISGEIACKKSQKCARNASSEA